MTSIPGTDNLVWSDEQTRFYLQLRIAEKLKGNIKQQHVNDAGRQSIIDKFYEEFGVKHPWKKFGIKHTTCKKQYDSCKRLTRNRTGLGYHPDGSINMSDDWWNDLYKEWPASRKLKDKPVPNMDLMEKVFSTCNVTGGEGWSAAQGEEHLDTMHLDQDNDVDNDVESRQIPLHTRDVDDAESVPIPPTQANTGNGPSSSNNGNRRSTSSRTKGTRKRPRGGAVAEEIRNSTESRDKLLAQKNNLIEDVVYHPEFTCSQFRAMEVLHSLPAVRVMVMVMGIMFHTYQPVTDLWKLCVIQSLWRWRKELDFHIRILEASECLRPKSEGSRLKTLLNIGLRLAFMFCI